MTSSEGPKGDRTRAAEEGADKAELAALRAYLRDMPLPVLSWEPVPTPVVPFDPLPNMSAATLRALEEAALEANDGYLETFLEPYSFCPFSRGGRRRGQTQRVVYFADTADVALLVELMADAARDPGKVVTQIIMPLVDVSAEAWCQFCYALTAAGNERLRVGPGAGAEIFAVAPLHPALSYSAKNALTLIPLLRRTPDPTIQWVRLDALAKLYEGRGADTQYVGPDELAAFLAAPPRPKPLFDRIAETNARMVQRLGIDVVERMLSELSRRAQARYAEILLGSSPPPRARPPAPSRHEHEPVFDATPARRAILERGGHWALVRVDELDARPRRFVAAQVELVVVRAGGDVHVLHGRCSHRNAPLSDARVEGDHLVCAHHGWDFALRSGCSTGVPGEAVARFRAWVADEMVWVDGAELDAWRATHAPVFREDDDIL